MAKIDFLYTIIITNYNNFNYIENALNSVFIQDYSNIELIITDDGSDFFDKNSLINFIEKNKKDNIFDYKFIINKKNIGTVKTLNKAVSLSSGKYILFFASDDELYDSHVISNYVDAFEKYDYDIVTSQWRICDENLKFVADFISNTRKKELRRTNSKKEMFLLCNSNIFGAGSTSYKRDVFERMGYFDERYILLEDWPFWLKCVSNNIKINYVNFNGLNHRSGGVSQNNLASDSKKIFYTDILNTFYYLIFPLSFNFSLIKQIKIFNSYKFHIMNYNIIDTDIYTAQIDNYINSNTKFKIMWYINKLIPHLDEKFYILFHNKVVFISLIIFVIVGITFSYVFSTFDSFVFLIWLLSYLIIFYIINILRRIVALYRGMVYKK